MAFDPAEIEDGYGVPGALVYEQTEVAETWLARRGLTALSESEEGERDAALLRATEAAENAVRDLVRGVPLKPDQGLLFPAWGAYDASGRLIGEHEIPRGYVEGIRLLAEHVAAGTFMKSAGGPVGVEEEGSRHGRIKYRTGIDFSKLSTNHPEEWRRIASVIPPP